MAGENLKIYGVQITGECNPFEFLVKKLKVYIFTHAP